MREFYVTDYKVKDSVIRNGNLFSMHKSIVLYRNGTKNAKAKPRSLKAVVSDTSVIFEEKLCSGTNMYDAIEIVTTPFHITFE